MTQQRHKRQLRNYLLDRRFQLKYTLVMVVTSALLTAGLGYFWYDEMRTVSRGVEVQRLAQDETLSEGEITNIQDDLARHDRRRLLVLVGFGVLLMLVLSVYGIVFTHKVAGPLFKAQRFFGRIADGELKRIPELRKGDQLLEFWSEFRTMHDALRTAALRDVQIIDEVLAVAETSCDDEAMESQLQALRDLAEAKKNALN